MSIWDEDELGSTDGGKLRKMLEKALEDNKELKKQYEEVVAKQTETDAVSILAGKGFPAVAARLAIADGVNLSDEKALEKWITENGDQFAKPDTNQNQQQQVEQTNQEQQQQQIPDGVQQTFGALNGLHAAATPALVSEYDRIMASIPADATKEQVAAAFKGSGL